MRLHRQKGSSLVEMALVLIFFLMIIFAALEFSIAMIRSAQLTEAARAGVRYAIVNNPQTELTACPSADAIAGADPTLIAIIASKAPQINTQPGINVEVKYSCPPASGSLERDDIYLVTVTISGAKYDLIVPGILGLDVEIFFGDFKSTRLSEDLHTVPVEEE